MKLNSRARLQLRLQSGVFLVLFVACWRCWAWLSQRYPVSIDMSSNQRNSLSAGDRALARKHRAPARVTLFVSPQNERKATLEKLFERYRSLQPSIR